MTRKPLKNLPPPSNDVRTSAIDMSRREAQFMVEDFYRWLGLYLSTNDHVKIIGKKHLRNDTIKFINKDIAAIRRHMQEFLGIWAQNFPAARWARTIKGIGPLISAGLAAFIEIDKCKNISALWKYAGLAPNNRPPTMIQTLQAFEDVSAELGNEFTEAHVKWLSNRFNMSEENLLRFSKKKGDDITRWKLSRAIRQCRYNLTLKRVCNSLGNRFIKTESIYQDLFKQRRLYEQQRNENGYNKKASAKQLDKYYYNPRTTAYKCYMKGKLPPGHINARAKRWAVKIFLAHYYYVEYYTTYGKAPEDVYALSILGGSKRIHIPNLKKVGK